MWYDHMYQIIAYVGEDEKQLKFSWILMGVWIYTTTLDRGLAASTKVEYMHTLWFDNPTQKHLYFHTYFS